MTTVNEHVAQWYQNNIDPKALDKKVEATLEYIKRFRDPDEDNEWVVFAHELVDGHHGQYTVRMFLDAIEGTERWMDVGDMNEIMGTFDESGTSLAKEFKKHSKLPGNFYVGHNEADGSLGVFYHVRA